MSRGVNKVILIGNLGRDPESRTRPSGGTVVNLALATSESWRGKDGQNQERTEWHRVVFFDRLADIANQYLRKGSKVYIEGKLQTREWTDRDGNKRYTTEVLGREMTMLDGRSEGGGSGYGGGRSSQNFGAPSDEGYGGGGYGGGGDGGQRGASRQSEAMPPPSDDIEDDIPF